MTKRYSISVTNLNRSYRIDKGMVERIAGRILRSKVRSGMVALDMVFLSDARIRRFNRIYKNSDRPTDVLSFGLYPPAGRGQPAAAQVLISVDRAVMSAPRYGSSASRELVLYIIHGLLHLVGYEDEEPVRKREMAREEERLIRDLWTREDLSKVLTRR